MHFNCQVTLSIEFQYQIDGFFLIMFHILGHFLLVDGGQTGDMQDIIHSSELITKLPQALLEANDDLLADSTLYIGELEKLLIFIFHLCDICLILHGPVINFPLQVEVVSLSITLFFLQLLFGFRQISLEFCFFGEIIFCSSLDRCSVLLSRIQLDGQHSYLVDILLQISFILHWFDNINVALIQLEWIISLVTRKSCSDCFQSLLNFRLFLINCQEDAIQDVMYKASQLLNNCLLLLHPQGLLINDSFLLLISLFEQPVFVDHIHLFLLECAHDDFCLLFEELYERFSGLFLNCSDLYLMLLLIMLDLFLSIVKPQHYLSLQLLTLVKL